MLGIMIPRDWSRRHVEHCTVRIVTLEIMTFANEKTKLIRLGNGICLSPSETLAAIFSPFTETFITTVLSSEPLLQAATAEAETLVYSQKSQYDETEILEQRHLAMDHNTIPSSVQEHNC